MDLFYTVLALVNNLASNVTRAADEIDEGGESAVQVSAHLAVLSASGTWFGASFAAVIPVHGIDNLSTKKERCFVIYTVHQLGCSNVSTISYLLYAKMSSHLTYLVKYGTQLLQEKLLYGLKVADGQIGRLDGQGDHVGARECDRLRRSILFVVTRVRGGGAEVQLLELSRPAAEAVNLTAVGQDQRPVNE